jgi:peptidoglycan/LPS O-acetylase OafA/YrhL
MAVLSESRRAPRFPLLDSVRAIAAITVVAYHASYLSNFDSSGSVLAPLLSRLDVGVTVFFLLSGFLLYRPFVRARLRADPVPGTGAYAWRRALRILPAYWVALTLVSLVLRQTDTFQPSHALAYYGLGQIYTNVVFGGIPQAWSLNVEITFYALLPLWAFLIRRLRLPRTVRAELLALAVLALIGIVWNVVWTVTAADPQRANVSRPLVYLPAYLDHFALGMALAVISVGVERCGRLPRGLGWLERRAWPAWLLAVVAYLVVSEGIGLSPINALQAPMTAPQALGRHWLYPLIALGVLLPAVFGPPGMGRIRRALGHRTVRYVGVVSYGLYLWHYGVMKFAVLHVPRLGAGTYLDLIALFAAGALGGVAIASASWHWVERPLLRLKRLVPDRALPLRDPETHAALEPPVPAGSGD